MNDVDAKKVGAKISVLSNLWGDLENLKKRLPMAIAELKKAIKANSQDKDKLRFYAAIYEPTQKFEAAAVSAAKDLKALLADVSDRKLKAAKTPAEVKEKLRKNLPSLIAAANTGERFILSFGERSREFGPPDFASVSACMNYNKYMMNHVTELKVAINTI